MQGVGGALKQSSSALSHGDGGEAGSMEGVVAAKPKKTRNANGRVDEKTFGIFARLGMKRSRPGGPLCGEERNGFTA